MMEDHVFVREAAWDGIDVEGEGSKLRLGDLATICDNGEWGLHVGNGAKCVIQGTGISVNHNRFGGVLASDAGTKLSIEGDVKVVENDGVGVAVQEGAAATASGAQGHISCNVGSGVRVVKARMEISDRLLIAQNKLTGLGVSDGGNVTLVGGVTIRQNQLYGVESTGRRTKVVISNDCQLEKNEMGQKRKCKGGSIR